MNNSFQMLSPFPTSISDFPPAGGFTALLTADDDDDLFYDSGFDPAPGDFTQPIPLLPSPETLESLIPPSILSGRSISPRKRPLQQLPVLPSILEFSQVQIPMLHSPDDIPPPSFKVPRLEPQPPTLDSIMTGFSLSDFVDALMAASAPEIDDGAPLRKDKGDKARLSEKDRRRIISEKIRNLGELIPGAPTKMTTAALLEAAHGYIKFLQAQVEALRSMPPQSLYAVRSTAPSSPGGVVGLLGSLTRQQLLQAVVNSPAAQAVLSSEKCCVVSAEQVVHLKKMLYERLSGGGAWM